MRCFWCLVGGVLAQGATPAHGPAAREAQAPASHVPETLDSTFRLRRVLQSSRTGSTPLSDPDEEKDAEEARREKERKEREDHWWEDKDRGFSYGPIVLMSVACALCVLQLIYYVFFRKEEVIDMSKRPEDLAKSGPYAMAHMVDSNAEKKKPRPPVTIVGYAAQQVARLGSPVLNSPKIQQFVRRGSREPKAGNPDGKPPATKVGKAIQKVAQMGSPKGKKSGGTPTSPRNPFSQKDGVSAPTSPSANGQTNGAVDENSPLFITLDETHMRV